MDAGAEMEPDRERAEHHVGRRGEATGQDGSVAFQGTRGYAAGEDGTVLRIDDGGASWIVLASGSSSNLTLLQEVDPNTVVVGGGCTVRESTDGGATFHRLPVNESEEGCATKVERPSPNPLPSQATSGC